ncbi:MAG: protein-L-isoaspartate(D-aspartate) O-methyltransferase [Chloroflexota bacterium]
MQTDARERLLQEIAVEVRDERVLEAIRRVPRQEFVPVEQRSAAYENRPLPIGHGQTISQPLIVAMMAEALLLEGGETVLEVGTGSGYQAAVLSQLAARVVSVERVPELANEAEDRLQRLGYGNVAIHAVGETLGWPEDGPYDGIIVAAAAPEIPLVLLNQLSVGGRLVIPVGGRNVQELVRIVKTPEGAQRHNLGPCRFVPLLGRSAWPERRR